MNGAVESGQWRVGSGEKIPPSQMGHDFERHPPLLPTHHCLLPTPLYS